METKFVKYRDKYGFIIKYRGTPTKYEEGKKTAGGRVKAELICCPERGWLRHVDLCEQCPFFSGYDKHKGVRCKSEKPHESKTYWRDDLYEYPESRRESVLDRYEKKIAQKAEKARKKAENLKKQKQLKQKQNGNKNT